MEAIIFQQNVDPLPIEKRNRGFKPAEGILNSEYKKTATKNLSNSNPSSIHNIRKEVRINQFKFVREIDTLLKVAIFGVAIAAALL